MEHEWPPLQAYGPFSQLCEHSQPQRSDSQCIEGQGQNPIPHYWRGRHRPHIQECCLIIRTYGQVALWRGMENKSHWSSHPRWLALRKRLKRWLLCILLLHPCYQSLPRLGIPSPKMRDNHWGCRRKQHVNISYLILYQYRVDLLHYLNTYKHLLGNPNLVICLDSSAYSKDTVSITSSLRGSISKYKHTY